MQSTTIKDKKSTISYIFMHLIFWCSYAVTWSYTAVYLEDCGYNNTIIGLVTGIGAVISVIMQPFLAALINRFQKLNTRTNIVTLKLASILIAAVIMLRPQGVYSVALLFILLAAIDASIPSMLSTLAMESVNAGRYINYGLARGIGSIAYALFSLFLGYAVVWFAPSFLMPAYIVLSAVTVGVSFLFPYSRHADDSNINNSKRTEKDGAISLFSKYPFLLFFLIASVTLFMGHNMINMFLVRIIERAGGTSADLGLALAIAATVELPVMGCFVKLSAKFKINKMLLFSSAFFVIKCVMTLIAMKLWMVYIAQFLQFGAFALFTPASVYFINKTMDEKDSGVGQALLGACSLGLGGALGNVLGGIIVEQSGVAGMIVCSIVLSAAGLGCMFISSRKADSVAEGSI